ncbi:hypothetical protein VTO73DRAFT_2097 [Trametes versicolor]
MSLLHAVRSIPRNATPVGFDVDTFPNKLGYLGRPRESAAAIPRRNDCCHFVRPCNGMHPVCMRPPTKKTSLIQALLWLNENTIGCNFKSRCARSGVSATALLVSQATHGGDHTIESAFRAHLHVLSSSTLEFSKALSIHKILAGPGIWDGPNLDGQASFTVAQAPRLGTPAAAAQFAFTSIIRASTYAVRLRI